jgi:undecaprenyl-diphosphatase
MLGAFVSAVAGTLVIRWLLSFLKSGTLWPFVWYRIALGLVVLVATAVGLL